MPIFNHTFTVDASLEAVRDFHHSTAALKKLSPPPMFVQLHSVEPLGEGSTAEFTLWFGPLPIRWKAIHHNVTHFGFTDVQARGPALSWRHTHTFTPLSPHQTRVDDHIEFEHHAGWHGLLTRVLFSPPNLKILFTFRQWATKRGAKKHSTTEKQ